MAAKLNYRLNSKENQSKKDSYQNDYYQNKFRLSPPAGEKLVGWRMTLHRKEDGGMGTSASAHLACTWIQDTTANCLGSGWEAKNRACREGTSLMLQIYFISNCFPQLVWGRNSPPCGRTWSFKENMDYTKSAGCKNSPPSFLPSFLWRWFDIAINSYK